MGDSDVEAKKRQLLKELGASSSSDEEDDAGSGEDDGDEYEDFDDMVVHDDVSEEEVAKSKAAPPWATINFGSSGLKKAGSSLAGIDGKRRSTLGEINHSVLEKERSKMRAETEQKDASSNGEDGQPKLRSWAIRRAATQQPAAQKSESGGEAKTGEGSGAGSNGAEQPKLRSWAARRTAAEVFGGDNKKEEAEENKDDKEAEEASSPDGDKPKMRSWVSRRGGSGGYGSLTELAEKYASLKQKSEQLEQQSDKPSTPTKTAVASASAGLDSGTPPKKGSPMPPRKGNASPTSPTSPLATSSKKPTSPPKTGGSPLSKASNSPSRAANNKGSPLSKLSGSGGSPVSPKSKGRFNNAIHGSLSRASQKVVHEELMRQQELHILQKKREKRAKYRAKQKVKKLELDEKKKEEEEKLKEERKKEKEKRKEMEIVQEEDKKLTVLEKKLREMVEEYTKQKEKQQTETGQDKGGDGGGGGVQERAAKIMEALGGAWFTNVGEWNDGKLVSSLELVQGLWQASKEIQKESGVLLKLDLSCFVFITVKEEGDHEKTNEKEIENTKEEEEEEKKHKESQLLEKTLKEAISKKFNPEGEEGGIGVSSLHVEELDVAKKFWASFDRFWNVKFVEKFKGEKGLKGLASTEELEKKVKVVRTLVGMLLWDHSLSLLQDLKYVTAKFSGLEGMSDITFLIGRPHHQTHPAAHNHWVGVLWGKDE